MYGSQTPIDIHCSKLVDWLVQRRHCKKDWGENLAAIRRKIRAALRDMPENEEIKQLLIGSKLDYFKSKRIVEILKMTEASSKNIFGYYSSQRMKDWQDIVYCYEKNYIYLAETATDLIRDTNYEVPGMRKLIGKLNREKEDSEKERTNLLKRAQQFNSERQKIAHSYGIKGENVAQELEEEAKSLEDVTNSIVELSKGLKSSLNEYRNHAKTISQQDANKFLPLLDYIIEKGNTTVYEWTHGHCPDRVELLEKATSSSGTNPSEIELVDDEIDFGEDPPSSESSSGFVHVAGGDNSTPTGEEAFIELVGGDSQAVCDPNEKVARGDEAKLVLEYRRSRNQFLNNLFEIEAFFIQIQFDLANTDDRAEAFLADGSARSRQYDKSKIDVTLSLVRRIMNIMNLEKNRILFQMQDSPSFVENVKEKLANKSKQANDCIVKADLLEERLADIQTQLKETEIHLKKCIAAAKELQVKVETSLQNDLYKGRPINIMGCVS